MLAAIRRIVTADRLASGCPADPDFELHDRFPLTTNDPTTTERMAAAFTAYFGDRAGALATCDTGTQALVVATLAWLGT